MADTKISGLAALGAAPAVDDLLTLVDISDTTMAPTGTNKTLTPANLFTSPAITGATTATITDAGTSSVSRPISVRHASSGTPTAGHGAGISFLVENDDDVLTDSLYIDAVLTTVTDGSEDADAIFSLVVDGVLVERGRLSSAGIFTASGFGGTVTDSDTNTVVYPLVVGHQSSGTPATGLGVGIAMDVETAAGNTERLATIEAVATDVGSGTEDGVLVSKLMLNGAAASEVNRLTWKSSTVAGWTFASSTEAYSQGGGFHFYNSDGTTRSATISTGLAGFPGFYTINNGVYAWAASGSDSRTGFGDTALERLAPAVVGSSNGSTGDGWLCNEAGSKRLISNVTNATATMANLTELSTTLVAGRKYAFKMVLFVAEDVAVDGVKIDFDGGAATMTSFRAHATVYDTALLLSSQTTAIGTDFVVPTVTGDAMIEVHGAFVCNAGGTFIPRAAQNSHTTGTLTVYLNSHILIEDTNV